MPTLCENWFEELEIVLIEERPESYRSIFQKCYLEYFAQACKVKKAETSLVVALRDRRARGETDADFSSDAAFWHLEEAAEACKVFSEMHLLLLEIECQNVQAHETLSLPVSKSAAGADPCVRRGCDLKEHVSSLVSGKLTDPVKYEVCYRFKPRSETRTESADDGPRSSVRFEGNAERRNGSSFWKGYIVANFEYLWVTILHFQIQVTNEEKNNGTRSGILGPEPGMNFFLPFAPRLFHAEGWRMYGFTEEDDQKTGGSLKSPLAKILERGDRKTEVIEYLEKCSGSTIKLLRSVENCASIASFIKINFSWSDVADCGLGVSEFDVPLLEKIFELLASLLRLDKFGITSAVALLRDGDSRSLSSYKMATFNWTSVRARAAELLSLARTARRRANSASSAPADPEAHETLAEKVDGLFSDFEELLDDVATVLKPPTRSRLVRRSDEPCGFWESSLLDFAELLAHHCETLYGTRSVFHEMFWVGSEAGREPLGSEAPAHFSDSGSLLKATNDFRESACLKESFECANCRKMHVKRVLVETSRKRVDRLLETVSFLGKKAKSYAAVNSLPLARREALRSEKFAGDIAANRTLQNIVSGWWNEEKISQTLNGLLSKRFQTATTGLVTLSKVKYTELISGTPGHGFLPQGSSNARFESEEERALCSLFDFLLGNLKVSVPGKDRTFRVSDVMSRETVIRDLARLCWVYYALFGGGLSALRVKLSNFQKGANPRLPTGAHPDTRLAGFVESLPFEVFSLAASAKCDVRLDF